MPTGPSRPGGRCVRPFRAGSRGGPDLPHDARVHRAQLAHGEMDGFIRAVSSGRQRPELGVMAHYDGRDLPFYWNVADEYVLFDRFFATAPGGSVPQPAVLGERHSRRRRRQHPRRAASATLPTIFDRLERRGVSWKFYVENYDSRRSFRDGRADTSAQAVRVPLLNCRASSRTRASAATSSISTSTTTTCGHGTLPAVSYIAPGGSSEHPPRPPQAGQTLVRTLMTALARSSAWPHSAFMLDLRRLGRLVRPRAPADQAARLPGAGAAGQPVRPRGRGRQHRRSTTPRSSGSSRTTGASRRSRGATRAPMGSRLPSTSGARRAGREIIAATRRTAMTDRDPRRWVIYLWYGAGVPAQRPC